ncbi:GtrA family protein [Sphingorhabdus arenilitoris]|uniref:GtrA family protein n=1 Tax=Sphingorhabdus arenilitoris TaxID=1490041 RepID=A0ABV8RFF0_9SPHN
MTRLLTLLFAWASRYSGIEEKKLRFLAAGGFNVVFGISIYPFLIWTLPYTTQRYLIALLISQFVCVIIAFFMHKIIVFQTRNTNILAEFWRFSSFYLGVYVINWAVLPILVELAHIPPIIAQTAFTIVTIILSYVWHNNISFRDQSAGNITDA